MEETLSLLVEREGADPDEDMDDKKGEGRGSNTPRSRGSGSQRSTSNRGRSTLEILGQEMELKGVLHTAESSSCLLCL